MKLPLALLLLASTATCEESEGVSLLQTHAHVHVHGRANETKADPCTAEDGETSVCWPGYKFSDFLPAGCISQGSNVQERGKCDGLITPSRVKAFNKGFAKEGCTVGYPNQLAWKNWIPSTEYSHLLTKDSTAEERTAAYEKCKEYGEKDARCAGANVFITHDRGCMCVGGVTQFHRQDKSLSCALKSRPASENPKQSGSYDGQQGALASIKETDSLMGCSKGWWVMAGGFRHHPFLESPGVTGWLDQVPKLPQYRNANHQWLNQKAWVQPPGMYASGTSTDPAYANPPSECAKILQKCIDDNNENCKDPVTGEWPKGASMIADDTKSYCKGFYGDVSEGVGAVTGEPAPMGALWNNQARWLCLLDGGYADDVWLEGAKKSGKYKEGGPKKKDEDEDGTPDDAEPLTKEEKAQCKADKKALREAQKLRRELKKEFKDARAAFRAAREALKAAKAKLIAQRNVVKELKAKRARCP